MSRKSSTETLIAAMRVLARDIQSGDGVANATIAEAADRLAEQQACIAEFEESVEWWQGCTKDCGDVINDGIESRQQLRAKVGELEKRLAQLPADWGADSSLKTWFPFSAKELDQLRYKVVALRREAQIHAQEARTANATIAEIYQLVTGATGEPGNWQGAEPVRKKLAALEAQAAIGRRAVEMLREIAAEADDPLCHIGQRVSAILRDAEQAESSNSRAILDSSDHFRGAANMVAGQQLDDAVNELLTVAIAYFGTEQLRDRIATVVHGLVRGE